MKANVHIINDLVYVTNEEGIKQDDCIYNIKQNIIGTAHFLNGILENDRKIILTNDKTLTTVQQLTKEEEIYLNSVDSCEVNEIETFPKQYLLKIPTEKKSHSFCETPEEKCTMNYCDENGCQNRKRVLAEPIEQPLQFPSMELEEVAENYAKNAFISQRLV